MVQAGPIKPSTQMIRGGKITGGRKGRAGELSSIYQARGSKDGKRISGEFGKPFPPAFTSEKTSFWAQSRRSGKESNCILARGGLEVGGCLP